MDERDTPDPLQELTDRLERARRLSAPPQKNPSENETGESRSALAVGLRIGLELVVAVFVGTALGWAVDRQFQTGPWGLILFLFLGFGAGVANVFRVALRMEAAVGYRQDRPKEPPPDE